MYKNEVKVEEFCLALNTAQPVLHLLPCNPLSGHTESCLPWHLTRTVHGLLCDTAWPGRASLTLMGLSRMLAGKSKVSIRLPTCQSETLPELPELPCSSIEVSQHKELLGLVGQSVSRDKWSLTLKQSLLPAHVRPRTPQQAAKACTAAQLAGPGAGL